MQPREIRGWLRGQIQEAETSLRDLESRRAHVAERLNALRLIESGPIDSEKDSVMSAGAVFHFRAAATLLDYGIVNIPMRYKGIVGDGKGTVKVDGQDYQVGISRQRGKNGRLRLYGRAEFKSLVKSKYEAGELLEFHIDAPERFSLSRVVNEEGSEVSQNSEDPSPPREMF